jgi:N-acetylmuramoyl-L-alanine amidase
MKVLTRVLVFVFCYCTALSINAQQDSSYLLSTPEKGEGLHAFLIRNNLDPHVYREHFIELNKDKLGKDNALILGLNYKIPESEIYISEPLYGKERERFELESEYLKGAVFHLVSGHGGPDPGALGAYENNTLAEDEYAYDITLRLAKKLQENGATVNMIIEDNDDGIRDDSFLALDKDELCMGEIIPLDQNDRLKQRTKAVNDLYLNYKPSFQRCVVIHVDSRSKGKEIDVFFYHSPKSKSGEKTALSMLDVFNSKYGIHQPSRGYAGIVSARNLYVLRKTYPTAVFIELGNISNFRDQKRLILPNNRQALANWMYEGLLNDFKANK